MQKEDLVKYYTDVAKLTEQSALKIASEFEVKHFKKSELILKENQISNEFYFVSEGIIRSYLYDLEGNEITLNFFSKSEMAFEVASFFQRIPSQENFEALEDCTVYFLSFDKLNNLFHTIPEFRESGRGILVRGFISFKLRTLSMLNKTAEERYAQLVKTKPELLQTVPLKYIASYLGITDTSLSRIRKQFATKN